MSDSRNRQLGAIHALKKRLALDDGAYRLMLREVASVDSAADLDLRGRNAVLDHLQAKAGARPNPTAGRPNNLDERPELQKIEALLAEAKRPWGYAESILRRMYRVERLQFASPVQLAGVIAALARDAARHDRRTR